MKVTYVSIFVILLVLTLGIPLFSGPGVINNASAKYAPDTQTQANANECESGTNCAINSPQTQGDGSASSPTNLQISEASTPPPTSAPDHVSIFANMKVSPLPFDHHFSGGDFKFLVRTDVPGSEIKPSTFFSPRLIRTPSPGFWFTGFTIHLPPDTKVPIAYEIVQIPANIPGWHVSDVRADGYVGSTCNGDFERPFRQEFQVFKGLVTDIQGDHKVGLIGCEFFITYAPY